MSNIVNICLQEIKEEETKCKLKVTLLINFYPKSHFPAGIYLLKVNNRNTRTRFEICSK